MKTIRIIICLGIFFQLFSIQTSFSQCPVTAFANPTTVFCGQSVALTAVADGCKPLNNNFNDGTINAGGTQPWASTNGATVQNGTGAHACVGPPAEGAYSLWMGTTVAAPRAITTNGYDLTACAAVSATLCFDMKYGIQAGASPCEGIDLPEEGVYIQYSIGGGAWQTLAYYDPNGGTDPTLTQWTRYCLDIPIAALGTNTAFRWYQSESSGAGFDAWGLDNMVINLNVPGYTFDWAHDAQGPGSSPATPNVTPMDDATYTVTYTNGVETCSDNISVTVIKPTATATGAPNPVCIGSPVQLKASSSIQMDSPTTCGAVAAIACTPFSSQADEQQIGSGTTTIAYNTGGDNILGNYGTATQTCQILFRASELTAAGMVAGKITNLSFDIQRIETSGGTVLSNINYPHLAIRLACTNLTTLSSSYTNVGAVQVYSGNNVSINTGWWTAFFNQGYNWDGASNIVVEICMYWENGASSQDAAPAGTGNYYAFARYNNVGYNCFFAANTNFSGGVCEIPAFTSVQTIRPNVKFGFCRPVNATLNYAWTSSPAGFTSSIKNPTHSPTVNTTYTVSIQQAGTPAGCAVTASVPITVKPSPTAQISPNPVEICTATETYEMLNALAFTSTSSCVSQTFSSAPASAMTDGNTSCNSATSQTFSINVGGVCQNSLATNPLQALDVVIVANGGALEGALVASDYDVYLDPPGGGTANEVLVVDNRGGSGATFNISLQTGAGTNVSTDNTGGLSGTYAPENPFPNSGAVMGEWKIRIVDRCKPGGVTGSRGRLASWSLKFNVPNDIVSYSWSPTTNLSAPTSPSTRITTSTAGVYNYTVTATDATGCPGTANVAVTVTATCTLPVELSSFDVNCLENGNELNWVIFSQSNNDYFTVEKSYDGVNFFELIQIDGVQNTVEETIYSFIDDEKSAGVVYYRLSQTDMNGVRKVLQTITSSACDHAQQCMVVYPNPTSNGSITIDHQIKTEEVFDIKLIDMLGKLVLVKKIVTGKSTSTVIELPENILPGMYYIVGENDRLKFCEQKLIVY